MSTEITYNDCCIAEVEAGCGKIIKCAGKKMKTDIRVTCGAAPALEPYDGSVTISGGAE